MGGDRGALVRLSLAALAAAVAATLVGWALLGQVRDLSERTEQAFAVYEDGVLTYTAASGATVTIPQDDSCKRYTKPPERRCLARFTNGDEVLVTFDSANPTRTWSGPTPGGFLATSLFWGGIAGSIFALFGLWFASPFYQRLRRPHIPGEQPRSVED